MIRTVCLCLGFGLLAAPVTRSGPAAPPSARYDRIITALAEGRKDHALAATMAEARAALPPPPAGHSRLPADLRIYRDVARAAAARGDWLVAATYDGLAALLAEPLHDSALFLQLSLKAGEAYAKAGLHKESLDYYANAAAIAHNSGRLGDPASVLASLVRITAETRSAAAPAPIPAGPPAIAPISGFAPALASTEHQQAVALGAARQALREAQLRQSLAQRDFLFAGALAITVIALLLATAYYYKRRAAAALRAARDAAEQRAGHARLAQLRYQLNPHLLFNTLNSIRACTLTEPARARELISRLSAFCRRALATAAEAPFVPLREEWAMLTDYLELQKARWENLLVVEADLDPALGDAPVPPFLLQPLVENAVKYGQRTSPESLRLRIAAAAAAGRLQLTVANTGRWLEPAATDHSDRSPVGLDNVRARLAALYAGRAALATAEAGGWVTVRLELPLA